jgi:hypothetical protein
MTQQPLPTVEPSPIIVTCHLCHKVFKTKQEYTIRRLDDALEPTWKAFCKGGPCTTKRIRINYEDQASERLLDDLQAVIDSYRARRHGHRKPKTFASE